ncbi:fatty acid-binding protein 1-like [Euwallacea fornicatus]|uniref:fatty acid-binding protein 1-like n=1 Tax=Euwallacea fornicatus TaxID=995702 RepID=UPI00338FEF76
MVQLDGTYEFVSDENYLEYLKSLGLSDEVAQKQAAVKVPVTIKVVPGVSVTASYGTNEVTFELGKEVQHTLSLGHNVKTTATINGDTINFKTKLTEDGSLSEEKVLKVTDSGLTSTSTNSKGVKYVRNYKRT